MASFHLVEHGTAVEVDSSHSSLTSLDTTTGTEAEQSHLSASLSTGTATPRKSALTTREITKYARLAATSSCSRSSSSRFTLATLSCGLLCLALVGLFLLLTVVTLGSVSTSPLAGGHPRGPRHLHSHRASPPQSPSTPRTPRVPSLPPRMPSDGNDSESTTRRRRYQMVVSLQQACAGEMTAMCGRAALRERLDCLLHRYYHVRYGVDEKGPGHHHHDANKHEKWNADVATDESDAGGTDSFAPVCWAWLEAREACAAFVRKAGPKLCRDAGRHPGARRHYYRDHGHGHHMRECLREADPTHLPRACTDSAYYQSVKLFGQLQEAKAAQLQLHRPHGL